MFLPNGHSGGITCGTTCGIPRETYISVSMVRTCKTTERGPLKMRDSCKVNAMEWCVCGSTVEEPT